MNKEELEKIKKRVEEKLGSFSHLKEFAIGKSEFVVAKMVLLAAVMLVMAQSAFAADDFTFGDLGYRITSQSKLEVELSSAPQQETIVVPETVNYNNRTYTVTRIGGSALSGHSTLTKIELPKAIVAIGGNAFYNCSSLTEIQLPENVTSIGSYAFEYCI